MTFPVKTVAVKIISRSKHALFSLSDMCLFLSIRILEHSLVSECRSGHNNDRAVLHSQLPSEAGFTSLTDLQCLFPSQQQGTAPCVCMIAYVTHLLLINSSAGIPFFGGGWHYYFTCPRLRLRILLHSMYVLACPVTCVLWVSLEI